MQSRKKGGSLRERATYRKINITELDVITD
jgi:hypothetical protein